MIIAKTELTMGENKRTLTMQLSNATENKWKISIFVFVGPVETIILLPFAYAPSKIINH